MNSYEARLEAKRQRLERASENAQKRSDAAFSRSHNLTAGIPFGQPILIGHHSESRHRNTLRKSDNAMRRAVEEGKAAEELARRAAAVGTGGISSDDPDAIAKLDEKRTELEIERDHMKSANAFFKKNGTLDGWDGPPELAAHGLTTLRVCPYHKRPFPAYALTNIGARIRDAAKRAKRIEATAEMEPSSESIEPYPERHPGPVIIECDPTENRVLVRFVARLSQEHYKLVRRYGFVWSPTRDAFVAMLSSSAKWKAGVFVRAIAWGENKTGPNGEA